MYYSQFGEDKILAKHFKSKSAGACVEVGANDGVHGSTSLFFEQLGWDCILIEPNPALCASLRAQRAGQVFEYAASNENGTAVLQLAEGDGLAHAVSTICDGDAAKRTLRNHGVVARPVTVSTRRLDNIFEEAGVGQIDFISIDVEGHELEVLKGFSLARWQPSIVIIEDNSLLMDRRVRRHMRRFGYVRYLRTGVNDWYAHVSNSSLTALPKRLGYYPSMIKARALMLSVRLRAKIKHIPGATRLYEKLKTVHS